MARKNISDIVGGSAQSAQPHPVGSNSKQRPTKYYNNSTKYFKAITAITPPPPVGKTTALSVVESEQQQPPPVQRSSPRNIPITSQGKLSPSGSPKVSPRTSPGILGRHYAGCKFSEPPAPAMLPRPPQHWTLTSTTTVTPMRCHQAMPTDGALSQQLKVLLKVQS